MDVGDIMGWGMLALFAMAIGMCSTGIYLDRQEAIRQVHESEVGPKTYIEAFKGQHKLRKMRDDKNLEGHITGSFSQFFFIGAGSIEGDIKQQMVVMFSWEYVDPKTGSVFLLDQMPYDKVMVKFADVEEPTIEFNYKPIVKRSDGLGNVWYWDKLYANEGYTIQPVDFARRFRVTALVRCKQEHWPVDIQLPLNTTKK